MPNKANFNNKAAKNMDNEVETSECTSGSQL